MEALNSFYCNSNVVVDTPFVEDCSSQQESMGCNRQQVTVNDSIMYQNYYDRVKKFHFDQHQVVSDLPNKKENNIEDICNIKRPESSMPAELYYKKNDEKKDADQKLKGRAISFSSVESSNCSLSILEIEDEIILNSAPENRLEAAEKRNMMYAIKERKGNLNDLNTEFINRESVDIYISKCIQSNVNKTLKEQQLNLYREEERKEGEIESIKLNICNPSWNVNKLVRLPSWKKKFMNDRKNAQASSDSQRRLVNPVGCNGLTLDQQWEQNLDSGTDDISDLDSGFSDDDSDSDVKMAADAFRNENFKDLNEEVGFSKIRTYPDARSTAFGIQRKRRKLLTSRRNASDYNASNDEQKVSTEVPISYNKLKMVSSMNKQDSGDQSFSIKSQKEEKILNTENNDMFIQTFVPLGPQCTIDVPTPICSTTAENTPLGTNGHSSSYDKEALEPPCSRFSSPPNPSCSSSKVKIENTSYDDKLEFTKCKLWSNFHLGPPAVINTREEGSLSLTSL